MTAVIEVDLPSRSVLPSKSTPHPLLAGRRYVTAGQNSVRYRLVPQAQLYTQRRRHGTGESEDRGRRR